jgi:uncharacterized protein (DUF608 family)
MTRNEGRPAPSAGTASKARFRKAPQRRFRGASLAQIALPLGGIGAGSVCLNGYGGLQDFSLRHRPSLSAAPERNEPREAAFALLRVEEGGVTRLVEGPLPVGKIWNFGLKGQGHIGGGFEGLPRFRSCSFKGEFPFGTACLSDPDLPFVVEVRGWNPFIPLDAESSSLPCAILEYRIANSSDHEAGYAFSYHLSHLAHRLGEKGAVSEVLPGKGVCFRNTEAGLGSSALGFARPSGGDGSSPALPAACGEPIIKARWFRGGWFDAPSRLWDEVSHGGFEAREGIEYGEFAGRMGGSIQISGRLGPGEAVTIPIVIAWHFPAMPSEAGLSASGAARRPWYATRWADARAVLFEVIDNHQRLRARTGTFHDALFGSSLPAVVLDAVSANLGVLKSPTLLREEEGGIWAWEGCFSNEGCCAGSCTHVWNYAQALPWLFPELERSLRELELLRSMDGRGHVEFRAPYEGMSARHEFHAAADGQLGGIMKLHREWLVSGDREWLRSMYPLARRSIEYCIDTWDPRGRGLVEEPHHTTYDIEFWGPEALSSSFYIGALAAMASLAAAAGEDGDAPRYAELAQRAATAASAELFNGEYYQQKVIREGFIVAGSAESPAGDADDPGEEAALLRAEGPKYQYGSGCLSDGVFGAWLAELCGVESPQDHAEIRSHLSAVYSHNFRRSLADHVCTQRPGYALGEEAGLLLCTWPRGGRPSLPFVYSDEVWTGIEYQVASHLISEGMVGQGLEIVAAVRARYDGIVRNPWSEYECGNWYARALSSWGLLVAASGWRYEAPTRCLRIAPRIAVDPFRCFFSTATGWGSFVLRAERLEIRLAEGELRVDELRLQRGGDTLILELRRIFRAGRAGNIRLPPGTEAVLP